MIDHVSVAVSDLARARRFYDAVLAPLGLRRVRDERTSSGYGPLPARDDFWIAERAAPGEAPAAPPGGHVALSAPSRDAVRAFHAAALELGATDAGAPGFRPHHHDGYFAAYVCDPDGNRVEAVFHARP